MTHRRRQHGVTLIELVISIVIIGIVATTIIGLLAFMSRTSADSMVRQQSANIAKMYLEQTLEEPFATMTDKNHAGVRDVLNRALPAPLTQYSVAVTVQNVVAFSIAAQNMKRVTVVVTGPFGEQVSLSGFKSNHP